MGDFPFHEFVQHISGKSSYDMISGIKEFYSRLPEGGEAEAPSDGRMTEEEWMGKWFQPLIDAGVKQKTLCEVFRHDHRQLKKWSAESGMKPAAERNQCPTADCKYYWIEHDL